jgi:hypothetical protein
MSEARSISQLVNEVTSKTGREDDFIPIEESVLNGNPITRKIKLSTLLGGLLIPSGGEIDVDENSFENVKDIDCEDVTCTQIEATGNDKNSYFPFVTFKIDNGSGSAGTTITDIDNNIIGSWQTDPSPLANMTGNYFEIPNNKCDQLFKFMYYDLNLGTLAFSYVRYNRVTTTKTDTGLIDTFSTDANAGELLLRRVYDSSLVLTSDEDLRIYIRTGFANVLSVFATIYALR